MTRVWANPRQGDTVCKCRSVKNTWNKNNPVYSIFIARLKCFESLNLQLKYMHWVILSPFLCFRWVFWCWTNSFQSVCSMLLYCQSQVWKFCFCHFWKKKPNIYWIKVCKSFFFHEPAKLIMCKNNVHFLSTLFGEHCCKLSSY